MPSLADNIRANRKVMTRDASGQLSEQSMEETQGLAQQAGLSSPPVTPVGVGAIGGSPDQQKMAGTPAQKGKALAIAGQVAPDQTLEGAMRRGQVRTQATAAETGKIEKSQNLANLGSLGDRVNDFINQQKQKLDTQNAQLQANTQVTGMSGESQAATPELQADLAALSADPTNMQLQLKVNQALGYDANRQLSPAEVAQLYQSTSASIGQSAAQAIDNNLTAGQLIEQGGLGYDAQQLSDLLGVPADQVAGMSVADISAQVQNLLTNEYSATQQLEQQSQSGQLGEAERALARGAAREASQVGTRATEADMGKLNQEIEQAGQVSFGGKVMSVEQMLSDDNISNTISQYLSAAPGSPERLQLEKTEPGLVDFVKRNEAALADASAQIGKGATQFSELQTANRAVMTDALPNLSSDIMGKIIPGYNQLSAEQIQAGNVPLLAATQGMNPQQKQAFSQDIGILATQFPDSATELAVLNPTQINQLGFGREDGRWKNYERDTKMYDTVQQADDSMEILEAVFSDMLPEDLEADLQQSAVNTVLGIGRPAGGANWMDANNDGKLDDPATMKATMADTKPTLADTAEGKRTVISERGYKPAQAPLPYDKSMKEKILKGDPKSLEAALNHSLGKLAGDGKLDEHEIVSVYTNKPQKLGDEELRIQVQELTYLRDHAKLGPAEQSTIAELLKRRNDQLRTNSRDTKTTLTSQVRDSVFGDMEGSHAMINSFGNYRKQWDEKYQNLKNSTIPELRELGKQIKRKMDIDDGKIKLSPRERTAETRKVTDYLSKALEAYKNG